MSVILYYISNTGSHRSLLTPYIPEIGVNNWVPCLWRAADLWEGACIEASVNFQNVTGCDSSSLTSSQCPLECFLVKGSSSDLSSLVSSTSSSFLYPCPSPLDLKQNIPFYPPLLTAEVSCVEHLSGLHLQWHGQGTKKLYLIHEKWIPGPFLHAL